MLAAGPGCSRNQILSSHSFYFHFIFYFWPRTTRLSFLANSGQDPVVAITVAKGNSTRRVQRPQTQTQTHNSCFGPNQEENTSCCSPSSGRPLSAPLLSDGTYTTYTTTRLFPINPPPPIKQEEKRKHIINEVIETERAYVSFLSLLVQVHFSLLRVPSLCATLILLFI
jgi:hypothetical protein